MGSVLVTRRDLTDDEVRKDAVHRLERAVSTADKADWVDAWGGAIRQYLKDGADRRDEVADLEEEIRDLERAAVDANGVTVEDLDPPLDALADLVIAIKAGNNPADLLPLAEAVRAAIDGLPRSRAAA